MKRILSVAFLAIVACTTVPRVTTPPPTASAPNIERANARDSVAASIVMSPAILESVFAPTFTYDVECVGDCGGTGGWREVVTNTVVTQGKNDLIDCYFKQSTCPAAWYLGLKGSAGSIAAGDTLASHTWTETTPYAGNRPAITFGTTSGGSNTATAVSYSINATQTVHGAFACDVNTGTAGILYSVSDFGASRSVVSGDTLNVTLTVSF